jgi:hypothetical protein
MKKTASKRDKSGIMKKVRNLKAQSRKLMSKKPRKKLLKTPESRKKNATTLQAEIPVSNVEGSTNGVTEPQIVLEEPVLDPNVLSIEDTSLVQLSPTMVETELTFYETEHVCIRENVPI